MTDREAIEILSDCRYCHNRETTEDGEIECLGNNKCFFAHSAAVHALQEREERSKGCEYCADHKYNVEDCVMLSHDESDFDRGMYIYDGELISNSGEFQCVRINFCPMCGRKLKGADNG